MKILKITLSVLAVIVLAILFNNANEQVKCESFSSQNLSAYLIEGILTNECIMAEREVSLLRRDK